MLHCAVPVIVGVVGMFSRIHLTLNTVEGGIVILTMHIHNELDLWRHLINSLV